MKTSVKKMDYEKVMALPRPKHKLPRKPNMFWRVLIRVLTIFGMMGTKFKYETEGFEKIGKVSCENKKGRLKNYAREYFVAYELLKKDKR